MELTAENYYDNATSFDYMSTSLYKDFRKCEAFALAKLNGEYMPVMDPTALLVGNYVHSYFESEASHSAFIEKNKDAMMTKSGAVIASTAGRRSKSRRSQVLRILKLSNEVWAVAV